MPSRDSWRAWFAVAGSGDRAMPSVPGRPGRIGEPQRAAAVSRPVRVTVLGAGSWGTTVASLAAANAATLLWARDPAAARQIDEQQRNGGYLPELALHPQLRATANLEQAVEQADVLVVGVPSHSVRDVLKVAGPAVRPWIPVISLTKGLEQASGLRMTEVIDEVLPGHPVGVLAGPNLAREVLAGYAAAAVIAMRDQRVADSLQAIFSSPVFRVYTSTDVLGCEFGGCLKNVVAVAAGMADGLGVGDNTRAMVITRGLAEITRARRRSRRRPADPGRSDRTGRPDGDVHEPVESQPACRGRAGPRPPHR